MNYAKIAFHITKKKNKAVESIEALDKELERLHDLIVKRRTGYDDAYEQDILLKIMKFADTLHEITRKHNGLEIK